MVSMPQLDSAAFVNEVLTTTCRSEEWRIRLVKAAGHGLFYSAIVAGMAKPDVEPSRLRRSFLTHGEREAFDRAFARHAEVADLVDVDEYLIPADRATAIGRWILDLVDDIPLPPPQRRLTKEEAAELDYDEDDLWRQAWIEEQIEEGARTD